MALYPRPADTDRRAVPENCQAGISLGQQACNGKGEGRVAAWETRGFSAGPGQASGLFQPFNAQKSEQSGNRWPPE